MKNTLFIFRNLAFLFLLATFFYNCAGTQKAHPTDLLPEPTFKKVEAHTAIKKSGGYVEIRILPDSVAKDQSFLDWWSEEIFVAPCDTILNSFKSNNDMSGGAELTSTVYKYSPQSIQGGFRLFAVEYVKPQPVGPLLASTSNIDVSEEKIEPVLDFFVGSVTFVSGDVVTVPFGPVSMTKTRDGCCPAPEMLYSTQQLRSYTPPVKKEKEPDPIEKPHWNEPKQ